MPGWGSAGDPAVASGRTRRGARIVHCHRARARDRAAHTSTELDREQDADITIDVGTRAVADQVNIGIETGTCAAAGEELAAGISDA